MINKVKSKNFDQNTLLLIKCKVLNFIINVRCFFIY